MAGASGVDAKSRFEQGSREAYRTQRKLVDSDLRTTTEVCCNARFGWMKTAEGGVAEPALSQRNSGFVSAVCDLTRIRRIYRRHIRRNPSDELGARREILRNAEAGVARTGPCERGHSALAALRLRKQLCPSR
jgi:hypothetical protein